MDLHGVLGGMAGLVLVALGGAGLLAEALLLWLRRRRGAPARAVLLSGPGIMLALGVLLVLTAREAALPLREVLDVAGPLLALLSPVPWIRLRLPARRRPS